MRIGKTIYLDHQATTPVDPRVLSDMLPYFGESFANPHSSEHAMGWAAARAVEDSVARIARLIGGDADEIIFTSGATESNNLALTGLSKGPLATKRRQVLLSSIDHKSSLAVGRALQETSFVVTLLRVDSHGSLDLDDLRTKINETVLVLSLCAVNSEIGTIQNLSEIQALARHYGVMLHVDAAQAPCGMDVSKLADVAELISLSAHKMYGPKGIGALYVRRDLQRVIQPIIHGGGQQNNLRSGTIPTALCVGFGAAAELLNATNAGEEREHIRQRRDLLLTLLSKLPWSITINGDATYRHPGNVNVQFEGFSGEDILDVLQPRLAASTGSACTLGAPEPSHVLRAIGLTNEQAAASVRFCVGRYTTDADIHEAVELISGALAQVSESGTRSDVFRDGFLGDP
jgi:cysteine desulfurase